MNASQILGALGAGFLAGAINSVAGGGTLVSFPVLIFLGLPPIVANATNTVGIWPGSVGSVWGFRTELGRIHKRIYWFLLPAIVGGVLGALLLRETSSTAFEKMVPWLILFATALIIVQGPVQRRLKSVEAARHAGAGWLTMAMVLQLAVAIYGGYFGAGMSIMMLSMLGMIGMTDILEMTATTSLLSGAINGVAGILFAFAGLIAWPVALAMSVGSLSGGYLASGVARRIGKVAVRRFVILVGLLMAAVTLARLFRP